MESELAEKFRGNEMAQEAAEIAARCVQCGQCTVNCPTFRILNDDWDSPRGRISLIRQTLEGQPSGSDLQLHLDRCLTCRSCEAMCPEGVRFGRLLDITREQIEPVAKRRHLRNACCAARCVPWCPTGPLHRAAAGRPGAARRAARRSCAPGCRKSAWPGPGPPPPMSRTMLVWQGCVQPAIAPDINAATARVLDRCGIRLWRPRPAVAAR
jgi:glycolate oxidase iron-sulfur subunit